MVVQYLLGCSEKLLQKLNWRNTGAPRISHKFERIQKDLLILTKFRGSSCHFCFDYLYIVDLFSLNPHFAGLCPEKLQLSENLQCKNGQNQNFSLGSSHLLSFTPSLYQLLKLLQVDLQNLKSCPYMPSPDCVLMESGCCVSSAPHCEEDELVSSDQSAQSPPPASQYSQPCILQCTLSTTWHCFQIHSTSSLFTAI